MERFDFASPSLSLAGSGSLLLKEPHSFSCEIGKSVVDPLVVEWVRQAFSIRPGRLCFLSEAGERGGEPAREQRGD